MLGMGLALIGPATLECDAQNRVLFIGNSFTAALTWGGHVSVPDLFDALAQAGGQEDPHVAMRAFGGYSFEDHVANHHTQSGIQSEQWTHVVLQNYSSEPTHLTPNGGHTVDKHFTYGTMLYNQVMANSTDTRVVLYETWARHANHPLITGISSNTSFASTTEMMNEVRTNYALLAEQLNAANPDHPPVIVSPVGSAWENAGGNLPPDDPLYVDLFNDPKDYFHGDDDGYYLAACVMYAMIYKASPVGLSDHPLLSSLPLVFDEDPAFLEAVAWQTVLDRYAVEPPRMTMTRPSSNGVTIEWNGKGALEWADDPAGPWTPVVPQPAASFTDTLTTGKRFYRLQYDILGF
jgi:hypothetical protein